MSAEPAPEDGAAPEAGPLWDDGSAATGATPDYGIRETGRTAARDRELARAGWRRRFVGGGPRLAELVALYESLGHEVRLEPVREEDLGLDCRDCALALALFRIVYTRSAP